jgi:hypothetical protein
MADETTAPAMSESEKKKEDWMNSKWRPMMGWMYMGVCSADFIVFPVLWSLLQSISHGAVNTQWQPLTLQGAGLFHIAMGAVLGIAAMGRTQEKLAGANNGGIQSSVGTTYTPPSPIQQPASGGFGSPTASTSFGGSSGFGAPASAPAATGFGTTSAGFGAVPPASPVTLGFGGKKAPVQPDHPEI